MGLFLVLNIMCICVIQKCNCFHLFFMYNVQGNKNTVVLNMKSLKYFKSVLIFNIFIFFLYIKLITIKI